MYLVLVVVINFGVFSAVLSVNKGRVRIRPKEIAYGDIVDYSSLKRNYPFMSRLLFDDLRCGGALISDRCILRNTSYSYISRQSRTQSY